MNKPMQPAATQPFWTARAGEAIRARTRARLAEVGVTQPQWWVLHQLSDHPDGIRDNDLIATVGPNDSDASIIGAIEFAIDEGWIDRREDGLHLTQAGADQFRTAAAAQQDLNDERRRGISDADYVTTIEVLQRTIANVGGQQWHW